MKPREVNVWEETRAPNGDFLSVLSSQDFTCGECAEGNHQIVTINLCYMYEAKGLGGKWRLKLFEGNKILVPDGK